MGTLMLLAASLLSPSEAAGVRTRGSRPGPCRRRTPPRSGPESESADADPDPASGSRSGLTWPKAQSDYQVSKSLQHVM